MFFEIPQNLILMTTGAFLLGWLLSSLSGSLRARARARKRDPRDDRIRSLEAELRIAQTDSEKVRERLQQLEKEVAESIEGNEKRDNVITHQQTKIEKLTADLRESVKKTRELRAELSDRATENLRSEVKLREVETELEVAQASTDLIATGVLDYSLAVEADDGGDAEPMISESDMTKTAT